MNYTMKIMNEVNKVMVGKENEVKKIMLAILAKGHILLEDVPGVGKTTLAKAFSKALGLDVKRMQFTPDVLPSDIVGFNAYDPKTGILKVYKGAVFTNLFLADEINRTSSRTQSALLEVMEENQISIDGVTYDALKPFHVFATQNPFGSAGTQRLPENQLDRFMLSISIGYPNKGAEIEMLKRKQTNHFEVENVIDANMLLTMQDEVEKVYVHEDIMEYVVNLVSLTRSHDEIMLGASPRASIALVKMSKANAYMFGRDYVVSEDVKSIFYDVMRHRIFLKDTNKKSEYKMKQTILKDILFSVEAPYLGKPEK